MLLIESVFDVGKMLVSFITCFAKYFALPLQVLTDNKWSNFSFLNSLIKPNYMRICIAENSSLKAGIKMLRRLFQGRVQSNGQGHPARVLESRALVWF